MGEAERLFIGVPVDEAARATLLRQLPRQIPGKPTPPENWHFTLKFLGSTEAVARDRLIEAMRAASFGQSFNLSFDRLGAFPNAGRARVLWIGTGAGHERLEAIAQKVEAVASGIGFEREKRPFKPHLTISRMKEPASVMQLLSKVPAIQATMRVNEVMLYRSELGGSHSRYSVVARFSLG
ncbi:MAG TPA: RNA 2',3'-cyclic phosphodiesterase [Gemmatimonadaceae bacterium]